MLTTAEFQQQRSVFEKEQAERKAASDLYWKNYVEAEERAAERQRKELRERLEHIITKPKEHQDILDCLAKCPDPKRLWCGIRIEAVGLLEKIVSDVNYWIPQNRCNFLDSVTYPRIWYEICSTDRTLLYLYVARKDYKADVEQLPNSDCCVIL